MTWKLRKRKDTVAYADPRVRLPSCYFHGVAESARIGEILASKYRLEEELGRGGMGAVYRAFHVGVHKQFAVKVLTAEVAGKKSVAARLVLEAQAAGRIGHPGILEV